MSKATLRPAIVIFGGRLQQAGLPRVAEALYERYDSRRECRIYNRPYFTDIQALATEMRIAHAPGSDIRIFGYSWGGDAAIDLARELRRSFHEVRNLCLFDPVPRRFGFIPFGGLVVPGNVRYVDVLRQGNARGLRRIVNGRKVRLADKKLTTLRRDIILEGGGEHEYLDDHPKVLTTVLNICAEYDRHFPHRAHA